MKGDAQCVNLVSENSDAEAYDVRCAFDEEHNEWLYVISMPEKDKMVLEEICKGYKNKDRRFGAAILPVGDARAGGCSAVAEW